MREKVLRFPKTFRYLWGRRILVNRMTANQRRTLRRVAANFRFQKSTDVSIVSIFTKNVSVWENPDDGWQSAMAQFSVLLIVVAVAGWVCIVRLIRSSSIDPIYYCNNLLLHYQVKRMSISLDEGCGAPLVTCPLKKWNTYCRIFRKCGNKYFTGVKYLLPHFPKKRQKVFHSSEIFIAAFSEKAAKSISPTSFLVRNNRSKYSMVW